jgi:hypothetical protein
MDTTEMIDPVTGEIIDEQQLAERLLRQACVHACVSRGVAIGGNHTHRCLDLV